jgi:uncharacterized protein YukJ
MALNYGVLKGTVTGDLRDADDDHYEILVTAGGAKFRIAVNVRSSLDPPDLLFESTTSLPAALTNGLAALAPGFTKLAARPGGLAQDFVRGGIVDVKGFKVVPGDKPGAGNDLKDTLEAAVVAAMAQAGSLVYAFGDRWGPEQKKDQYFKFAPGNGIHDIHMNQGNDKSHASEDGVFQDGCLFFQDPSGGWQAFFLAFQSQSFNTDDRTGHAKKARIAPARSRQRPIAKRRRVIAKRRARRPVME